jgi:hypothetical protein
MQAFNPSIHLIEHRGIEVSRLSEQKAASFERFGAVGGVPSTRFVRDGVLWRYQHK